MRFVLSGLFEHWQLKLLSLVFAGGLWIFVASEDLGNALRTVPIALAGVPPDVEVTAMEPETVDVRVEGRRSVLARLEAWELRARVALSDLGPGETVVRVLPRDVSAPKGVKVVRVSPARVRLTLESVTRVLVPVTPRLVGAPAPGFRVTRVRVEPAQVEVRASGSRAGRIEAIETTPIDIEGARTAIRREAQLGLPAGVELAHPEEPIVVTVEVEPR